MGKNRSEATKLKDKQRARAYYQKNKLLIREKQKGYTEKTKAVTKAYHKEYYAKHENIERRKAYMKAYFAEHKVEAALRARKRRATDILYRIKHNLSVKFRRCLRGKLKTFSVSKILCYDRVELIKHLESKFVQGMTWDNYGQWHIDHIKPLVLFDLSDRAQAVAAYALVNLQPLWAKDNISKGGRF